MSSNIAVTSLSDLGLGLAEAGHDLPVLTNANLPRVSVTSEQGDCGALQVRGALALIHFLPVDFGNVEGPGEFAGHCYLNLEIASAIRPRLEVNNFNAGVESHASRNEVRQNQRQFAGEKIENFENFSRSDGEGQSVGL